MFVHFTTACLPQSQQLLLYLKTSIQRREDKTVTEKGLRWSQLFTGTVVLRDWMLCYIFLRDLPPAVDISCSGICRRCGYILHWAWLTAMTAVNSLYILSPLPNPKSHLWKTPPLGSRIFTAQIENDRPLKGTCRATD